MDNEERLVREIADFWSGIHADDVFTELRKWNDFGRRAFELVRADEPPALGVSASENIRPDDRAS